MDNFMNFMDNFIRSIVILFYTLPILLFFWIIADINKTSLLYVIAHVDLALAFMLMIKILIRMQKEKEEEEKKD